ncbi:response regulator transcription factor [Bacillus badius]|uniref:Phosphate regulon transcriptional regulatory protein PhoB (SphR) n=1 Tax=Bacillus badius TaxID=1455 RepID=A0ABR5AX09_BACBA|nr:response regulator transcription factor [Bacillus badius]KIL76143.1 Phosphate regulon transcriptional regulatory protein PhoB (SphR) [Bacillus badius]KIL79292.1 Phosphate regulon transcriptional regulatory protein PhoB (SphR) [Bacillus badius]KZR59761.1 DNA-binding response regulator [Bacillus badius]MED0668336.1 response regulator transcription factor [Bacillus badius]MED4716480.1 response regulator transcription factor [Bacillus badius]
MNGLKVMIIDDEEAMRQLVSTFLEKEGYTVIQAANGMEALSAIDQQMPDLLIVDVMMPYMDGYAFTKEVKRKYDLPLIFLSAKGEEWDKIHGLKLGGDDYIVKPFHPGELLARIESVLRRANPSSRPTDRYTIGPLALDANAYKATVNGKALSLTLKEYELLVRLAQNPGKVFSREQLLQLVWGEDYNGSERTVDTHVKTLRLKLKDQASLIQTVWGVGYKFEV